MAAERIADDADIQVDFSDLERKYAVKMDMGLETFVVADGTPLAPESKAPLLTKVLTKYFSQAGTIQPNGVHVPTKDGKTMGFVFIEYQTPEMANQAIKLLSGKRFDTKHTFTINKLADIERYGSDDSITETYVEPKKVEFVPREHLRSWLTDSAGRDQFFAHVRNSIQVNWYKKNEDPRSVGSVDHVDGHAKWSPKGTYLASNYSFGVQLNGGPSMGIVGQFLHYNAHLFDFSPNEQYLVTFSDVPIGEAPENDPENPKVPFGEQDRGNQVVIWNTRTQLPMRSFKIPPPPPGEAAKIIWPIFKWSADSKYFARSVGDQLSIYETPSMSLVDKKSVTIPGIVDFSFAPTSIYLKGRQNMVIPGQEEKKTKYQGEHILCYWTPEINDKAARVSIMSVPTKEVIRTRNVFNVADCRFHWQDDGEYLCVKVDRYTRNKKSTFTNLEFFRLTERDIPVEAIELKDTVINFAWEPKGTKFITVSRTDTPSTQQNQPATAPGVVAGPASTNVLSFYALEENKKKAVGLASSWTLVKKFEKKQTNSIYWSPKGRFAATSNFGPNIQTPTIEYWDTEYTADKQTTETTVHLIGTLEKYGLANLQWDPSGRYTMLWAVKGEVGYTVANFHGQIINGKQVDYLRFVSWRPRPASLLSEEEKAKVLKNLDKFSARFDEEDAMEADAATRELITKRRTQITEWYEFREKMVNKLKSEHLVPEEDMYKEIENDASDKSNKESDGKKVVEEIHEEILEQTEEFV